MTASWICIILMIIYTIAIIMSFCINRKANGFDGYLDIVQDERGSTAMLLELENEKAVNKEKVTLLVRKSQKIQIL